MDKIKEGSGDLQIDGALRDGEEGLLRVFSLFDYGIDVADLCERFENILLL